MITLESVVVIDIDSGETKTIRKIVKESGIKEIVIINMLCMVSAFSHIKELLIDDACLKIFHSGKVEMFNELMRIFDVNQISRKDIIYISELSRKKIATFYLKHHYKMFPATISGTEGTQGEQI